MAALMPPGSRRSFGWPGDMRRRGMAGPRQSGRIHRPIGRRHPGASSGPVSHPVPSDGMQSLSQWLSLGAIAIAEVHPARGGGWHGVGTAFKVFPGAMVLPAVAWIRGWRNRVLYLAAAALGLIVPYALYLWLEPESWSFHLESASSRTDFESSIWGVLAELSGAFGLEVDVGTVNAVSVVVTLALLSFVAVWVSKNHPSLPVALSLGVLAFLATNKVFKPQYVLWLLPFLAWAGVRRRPVRLVEATAIGHFAVVYLLGPPWVLTVLAAIRVVGFGVIAGDLVRLSDRGTEKARMIGVNGT